MNQLPHRIIFFFLFFAVYSQTNAQVKDKRWLLVDSVVYEKLSPESKMVLDSVLPVLHSKAHDSIILKNLHYAIENIAEDDVWPRYNDYMDNWLKAKPSDVLYLRYKGIVLNNKAYIAEHRDHDYVRALDLYEKSYEVLSKARSLEDMAAPINNMATIYMRFGNMQKCLELNFKALNILERTSDRNATAFSLNNIGNAYAKIRNFEKARQYMCRSYQIRLGLGNKAQIAQSLNNIGGVFLSEFKQDSALFYFGKSLEIAIARKSVHQMGLCYNNMSICYRDKKDFDKALEYGQKGLKYREEEHDLEGVGHSYQNLGLVYFMKGDNANARKFFEQGFKLSKDNKVPELLMNFSKCLYDLNVKEGRTKEALDNYVLFTKMKDSLNNKELQKLAFQKQFEYEYNKKAFADSIKVNEEKMLEQTRHQQVVQRQRFYIIGGIAGIVLMGTIAAVSLLAFRQKKKSNILINKQKQEVEHQKNIIEEKQKEIIDSINYAKRIQSALLANEQMIAEHVPEHFIFFRPKDIVSGDFYWATEHDGKFFIACCDSTGHGVPGAFMSLLNIGFLSEAIKEKDIVEPNKVFDYVRKRLIDGISKEGQKDGFDGILLCIDKLKKTMTYAAANNAPVLVSNGTGITLKKDKMPVGKGERTEPFSLFTLDISAGDTLYLFTDGYADQFGGPKGKKFMSKQLDELLVTINRKPVSEQAMLLESAFRNWVGDLEQVDDVLVIGIKL